MAATGSSKKLAEKMVIDKVRIGKKTLKINTRDPSISISIPVDQLISETNSLHDLLAFEISADRKNIHWPDHPHIPPISLDLLTGVTDTETLLTSVTYTQIASITGLHPDHHSTNKAGHLPHHVQVPQLDEKALLAWLEISPIVVQQNNAKVFCVANSRAYLVALNQLAPETPVPIRWYTGRNDSKLKRLIAADRLINPLLHYEKGSLLSRQYQLLNHLSTTKYPHLIANNQLTTKEFAKQLGVDERTVKKNKG